MKLTLNRQQLKTIAIISMVIDHIAWGFVDFYSPLGQFLHVLGRFTIPIMTFFIAEGFRKTSDLKKYIYRMSTFAVIAMIPFYLFFHKEYGYRQNIIFDLLLGLLVLTVLESGLKKWQKSLLTILLFAVSMTIGGWPVTPILFILSFYYGKTFRQKAKWFIITDVSTVIFLMISIALNSVYHFSSYEWLWWDKTYLLGFMLALFPLSLYNGEKGKEYGGRYFFYIFYPAHFLVLAFFKAYVSGKVTTYFVYLGVHVIALAIIILFLIMTVVSRPSKGQSAIITMLLAALIYVSGFMMEIMSYTVQGYHLAVIAEYMGEMILLVGLTYFIKVLCHLYIPPFVYALQVVIGILVMYGVMTTRSNHYFYRAIIADHNGKLQRLQLIYGPGFYMTISYIAGVCVFGMLSCIYVIKKGTELDKKRGQQTIYGMFMIWIPYMLKLLGFTGGYEIPGVGITFAAIVFWRILFKYGFLDSVTLASESALDHGKEGIIVYGTDYKLEYYNKKIENIFGKMPAKIDYEKNSVLRDILEGKIAQYSLHGRIYEFEREELREGDILQGYMLWVLDSTEHFEAMQRIRDIATKDPLTKLYNRVHFEEIVNEQLKMGKNGTFCMFDMDNFKQVNDGYGHQAGDAVLNAFADIVKERGKEKMTGCRIGGDEFAAFLPSETDERVVETVLSTVMEDFQSKLSELGFEGLCSISIGAVICDGTKEEGSFQKLYSKADGVLYEAKNGGKDCFVIRRFSE